MARLETLIDHLFTRQRWVVHVCFWLLVVVVYVIFFGKNDGNYLSTLFFVGLLMPVTIGTTYFLNYWLMPNYLLKERFGFFVLYFIYTLIGSLFVEMMIVWLTFIVIAEVQIKNMSAASVHISFLLVALLMVIFLGLAIKMLSHWRQSKDDYQQLMREKVESELRFLRMQLKPHFLFNTLNNLYYLTSEKSDKAPAAVLALSELLDYILRETKAEFVALEKEIDLVRNYIALESLRYEDRLRVSLDISGEITGRKITPMMLLTLVENAFKHGVMKAVGDNWIKVRVACSSDSIVLDISNSCRHPNVPDHGGIGLENLKHQLSLSYADRHFLNIKQEQNAFSVNLLLKEQA